MGGVGRNVKHEGKDGYDVITGWDGGMMQLRKEEGGEDGEQTGWGLGGVAEFEVKRSPEFLQ